jgi:alpha-1,2-mannosyltransferase
MSFPRVLVTSCRELCTRAPRTPYGTHRDKTFGNQQRLLRIGIAAAVLALAVWGIWAYLQRTVMWNMLDLSVYYNAVDSLKDNQDALYTSNFGTWKLPFIYPPFSALTFFGLVPMGFAGLKWFMTVTSLLALAAVVWTSWGMLGYRRSAGRAGATLATFAVVLWFEPVVWTLEWGQVNLALLAVLMFDLGQPDTRRWKGVGVGLAAGFKLTPLIFIVYLAMTRRFRAAGVALGTFLGTIGLGFVLLPSASAKYWSDIAEINNRVSEQLPVGTLNNQSVQGMFRRMLDSESLSSMLWLLCCAALAILVMVAAAKASLAGQELLGVVLVGVLSLLVSPISWSHHWVWVVPAFVLLLHHALRLRRRMWWYATAAFLAFYGTWPLSLDVNGHWDGGQKLQPWGLIWLAPRDGKRENRWNVWQYFVGNSYLFVGIALTVLVAWWVLRATAAAETGTQAEAEPAGVAPRPRAEKVAAES